MERRDRRVSAAASVTRSGRAAVLALVVALAGCSATLADRLEAVTATCPYQTLGTVDHERACEARRRAAFAEVGEVPGRWHESLWGFRALVAERVEAGAVSPAEGRFAALDYQRRLEAEATGLQATQDGARAAELGNTLTIWRTYFPNR